MGLEEEGAEGVKKKDKKTKEKSKKGKKDTLSGNWIDEAEYMGKDGLIDGFESSEKENGERGDNGRKKNKKKKVKNRLGTEESGDGYGERSGNDREKEPEIRGQKNHDGDVREKVERKKRKQENDKSRVSDTELREHNTSREGPKELRNGTDVAVGQGSDRVVMMDHKNSKKKSKKLEGNKGLGAEEQEMTLLTKQVTLENNSQQGGVEAGRDLESVEKRKKRKREKDKSIVSEGEVQGNDFDDPDGERQSTFDERDHNELLKGTNVKATAEGDVVTKEKKKKKKKSKKTKYDSSPGADTTMNLNNETKGKKKSKSVDNVSKDPKPNKGKKKVSFSDKDEVFPLPEDNLVRGKRFSKEEDEMVEEAVYNYVEANCLGDEGIQMVLNCKSHPKIRDCWKEIGSALPHRPRSAVYYRAQILFRRDEKRKWTKEEIEMLRESQKKHGNQWKALADELGKHRVHVKDTWRRIRHANLKSGRWSQEEYQTLFDSVNLDLRMKYSEEKQSKYGMLRDNVPWTAISDKLTTRSEATCCFKWYYQLTSPMVMVGDWVDSDDYRLIDALFQLDSSCYEDVDWDNLLDHRSGAICQKRWNEMVMHIGDSSKRSFADRVEVLAKRYCPELLEARENWDSKPYVP